MADDLRGRLERELGIPLPDGHAEDSELEKRIDAGEMARHREPFPGYSGRIGKQCDLVIRHFLEMERVNSDIGRVERIATDNILLKALRYAWMRITGRKVGSFEALMGRQIGNVHRFNDALAHLMAMERAQLKSGMREYVELSGGYATMDARIQRYAGVAGRKDELRQEAEARDDMRYRCAAWLLGRQVNELRHEVEMYSAGKEKAGQDIESHKTLDDRLREHVHLLEVIYAESLSFERRAGRQLAITRQLIAQHRLTSAVQEAMGMFSSYTDQMRSRLDDELLTSESLDYALNEMNGLRALGGR